MTEKEEGYALVAELPRKTDGLDGGLPANWIHSRTNRLRDWDREDLSYYV